MNKSLEENGILKFAQLIFPFPQWETSTTAHVCNVQFTLWSRNILTSPNWRWPLNIFTIEEFLSWVVMFCTNLSIFWAVWVFLARIFIEEEDVDFHWSLVQLSHMCRHSLCKDDITSSAPCGGLYFWLITMYIHQSYT